MKKIFLVILVIVMALGLIACPDSGGNGGNGADAGTSIKVGAVLSLTGQYEEYGKGIKRGMELAIEELNANGGINGATFEIVVEDSLSTIEGAKDAFNKLAAAGVSIVIGPEISELAAELIPEARRNKIIMISPSASSPALKEIESRGYFYRICASDESEAAQIAQDIIRDRRGFLFIKRAYNRALVLVRKNNSYTEGLWRAFGHELNKLQIEYEIQYFDHEELMNKGEILTDILNKTDNYRRQSDDDTKEGVVVVFGYAEEVQLLLEEFKARYFDSSVDSEYLEEQNNLLVYTASAIDTAEFLVEAADVSEGLVFPRVFDPNMKELEIVNTFVNTYKEKYQATPDLFAAYGYDSALLIGYTLRRKDIEKAILEPYNFRMHMNDVKYAGVTGQVDFQQATGEVAKTPLLYKMKDFGQAIMLNDFEQERIIETRQKMMERMGNR